MSILISGGIIGGIVGGMVGNIVSQQVQAHRSGKRRIIFVNLVTGQEVVLPVTPKEYTIDRGVNIETVNLTGFGDVHLAGDRTLFTERLEFMLPVQDYPFNDATAVLDPFHYIDFFELTGDNKQVCRFIVSDSQTQCEVLLENLQYRQQEGVGDYYCVLTMRRHRQPNLVRLVGDEGTSSGQAAAVSTPARATQTPAQTAVQNHTVQPGDTLSGICRKYYGNANLYPKLAAYNSIKNPDLIYDGSVLKIPPASAL